MLLLDKKWRDEISVTKKLRPHWSGNRFDGIIFKFPISVTKKLRPHWSHYFLNPLFNHYRYFRNEKVTAPLKFLWGMLSVPVRVHISVTKKLRPHWSMRAKVCGSNTEIGISVTKKLRPHWSPSFFSPYIGAEPHFRNEKVTAPLKWAGWRDTEPWKGPISVTKKLRPHWSGGTTSDKVPHLDLFP